MTPALTLQGVSINFGGIRALEGVSCEVPDGQLRGIIGPNGSGKTTLLNVISRIYPVSAGSIRLFDDDITRWPNHAVARHGVMRTYQRVALVNQLTVLENVMLGLHATRPQSLLDIAFRTSGYRRSSANRSTAPGRPWSSSASRTSRTARATSSPGGRCASSRSPGPSCRGRGCCSSTSRRRA